MRPSFLIYLGLASAFAIICEILWINPGWNLQLFFWLNNLGQTSPELAQAITHLGDGKCVGPLLILLFATHLRRLLISLVAGLSVHLISQSLKKLYVIARPAFDTTLTQPVISLGPPIQSTDFSFPSGHSMTIAMLATLISYYFPNRWLGAALLVMSILVASSRSMVGAHFPTDTTAGLTLGIIIAASCIYLFERIPSAPRKTALLSAAGYSGISLIWMLGLWKIITVNMLFYPLYFSLASQGLAAIALLYLIYLCYQKWAAAIRS